MTGTGPIGALIVVLYILWLLIGGLVVRLIISRRAWRYPLRGIGPMLWSLLLLLVNSEITRAHYINTHQKPPPPLPASIALILAATGLILFWLIRQLELVPRWLRMLLSRGRQRRGVATSAENAGAHRHHDTEEDHHDADQR